jgi:hypothetical protein
MTLLAAVLAFLWSRFFPIDQLLGLSNGLRVDRRQPRLQASRRMTNVGVLMNEIGLLSFGQRLVPSFAAFVMALVLLPVAVAIYLCLGSAAYLCSRRPVPRCITTRQGSASRDRAVAHSAMHP